MSILITCLGVVAVIGLIFMLLGTILFVVAAFRQGILWGLGVLFFAPISLIFLILHWSRAKNSFILHITGIAIIAASVLVSVLLTGDPESFLPTR